MAAPPVATIQKKLGSVLQPGEAFLASVELASEKSNGATLAFVLGGVVGHAVQQSRRKRAVQAAQTIASRLSIESRVLGLSDRRLAIIKWDVFRPKLDSWIALPEIKAVSVEHKKLGTGALVLEFVDGSVIRRESTRRKQLIAFAEAIDTLIASIYSSGTIPTPASLSGRAGRPLRLVAPHITLAGVARFANRPCRMI